MASSGSSTKKIVASDVNAPPDQKPWLSQESMLGGVKNGFIVGAGGLLVLLAVITRR
jgi:hypothetical protein